MKQKFYYIGCQCNLSNSQKRDFDKIRSVRALNVRLQTKSQNLKFLSLILSGIFFSK